MSLEVQATYENGILKLDQPLPLSENERVTVTIQSQVSRVRQSVGLVPWNRDARALEHLLGPDNQLLDSP